VRADATDELAARREGEMPAARTEGSRILPPRRLKDICVSDSRPEGSGGADFAVRSDVVPWVV